MDPRMYPGGVDVVEATVDPASIAANTTGETAVAISGIRAGKSAVVFVNPPSTLNAGMGVAGAYVSADDEVKIRLLNTTAGAIDVASATWVIGTIKYKS